MCNPETGVCVCDPGFTGVDCSVGSCHANCSGHGTCVQPSVPVRLLSVGTTIPPPAHHARPAQGQSSENLLSAAPAPGGCQCVAGWTGADCSLRRCDDHCSGHGTCLNGTCACDPNYSGARCDVRVVRRTVSPMTRMVPVASPPPLARRSTWAAPCAGGGRCSGRGSCTNGTCTCDAGWAGVGCGERSCDMVTCVRGHGHCVRGQCRCRTPWLPPRCEYGRCPSDCSGPSKGYCNATSASCICKLPRLLLP